MGPAAGPSGIALTRTTSDSAHEGNGTPGRRLGHAQTVTSHPDAGRRINWSS
jgi:hypothetical protein